MEPRIQYAKTSDGVSIAYFVVGSGPALVDLAPAVLGAGTIGHQYQFLQAGLERRAQRHTCVVYDQRGTGMSERDADDLSFDAALRDVEAVISGAQLNRFGLFAGALSAAVAIALAVRRPDDVTHLILESPFVRWHADSTTIALGSLLRANWELFTDTIARRMYDWSATAPAEDYAAIIRASVTQETALRMFDAMRSYDVASILPQVRVPTLVIHRTGQDLFASDAQLVAAQIPNARLHVESAGYGNHDWAIYDAYWRMIEDFTGAGAVGREALGPSAKPGAAASSAEASSGTAIILFADVVDSTALAEQLGNTTFRERSRTVEERVRERITAHAGTPVAGRTLGDGVLATFASASDAIAAAVDCATAGAEVGLALHLGLHAGDVMRENANVYGQAVSIASRISGLSAPNEVLVSATVRDLARASAGVAFEDRGEHELKGVSEPVRVFAVVGGG